MEVEVQGPGGAERAAGLNGGTGERGKGSGRTGADRDRAGVAERGGGEVMEWGSGGVRIELESELEFEFDFDLDFDFE